MDNIQTYQREPYTE